MADIYRMKSKEDYMSKFRDKTKRTVTKATRPRNIKHPFYPSSKITFSSSQLDILWPLCFYANSKILKFFLPFSLMLIVEQSFYIHSTYKHISPTTKKTVTECYILFYLGKLGIVIFSLSSKINDPNAFITIYLDVDGGIFV